MENETRTTKRLVRRSHDRFVAGVAGGLADYFAVDPVLVRIAFVVLTFAGGAGAIAYVAGWLLIPEDGRSRSLGEEALRERNWARIAGIVLIVVAASSLLGPLWWFGGHVLSATVLILLGLFLLWHRGGDHDGGQAPRDGSSPDDATPGTPPAAPDAPGTPPPAPFDPGASTTETLPPASEPRRRRSRRGGLASITIGLLLVGAGIVGLVAGAGATIDPTRVFAGGVILVGLALVASAWYGRAGGLIPIGVLLVGLLSVSSLIDVPFEGGFGDRIERPTTIAAVQHEYHLAAGQLTVDLRGVTFAPGSTTSIEATVATGHLVVIVPRDVEVDVHGHAGSGQVRLFGDDNGGGIHIDRDAQLHAAPGAARIELDAEVGLGQVEVRDAAA